MSQNPHDPLHLLRQAMSYKNAAIQACNAHNYEVSAQQGTQSLTLESEWVCQQAGINHHVLSFSLFGDNPIYCETAILNAKAMPDVYPGWRMWVYHDQSVPEHVLQRLHNHRVRLLDVTQIGIAHWPGTFWRFHAVTEPQVAKVQFRDADSIISTREAQWVKQWMDSGKPFHVFRDWYSHLDLILAGMWGAHAPLLAHMNEWIEAHLQSRSKLHPTHADQIFLAEVIWPKIAPYCLVHDTVHDLPFATAIDSPRPGTDGSDALGGFKAKRITVTMSPHIHQYLVTVLDEQQQIVMRYHRTAKDGRDEFEMPTEYYQHVETGKWQIQYQPLPQISIQTSTTDKQS